MKALTLTQPWATLIALGEKRIETRGWPAHHRGPIAIHAAKGVAPLGGEDAFEQLCASAPFAEMLAKHELEPADLPRGAVVAIAKLVGCFAMTELGTALRLPEFADFKAAEHERAFGDYTPGRYAWVLRQVQPIRPPIEASGKQGLWDLPDCAFSLSLLREVPE